ncbi:hypothetical protein EJ110_NYTH37200 [Nymphaea thermarum]|nr:hypothetical protein EJ110_NYTH37200 [Nymphaea thermarum]
MGLQVKRQRATRSLVCICPSCAAVRVFCVAAVFRTSVAAVRAFCDATVRSSCVAAVFLSLQHFRHRGWLSFPPPPSRSLYRRLGAPKSENLPVQVTSIRLTKDNYLSWSAALEIGITSRGRLPYITGDKPAPSKLDPQWATWALEDSQVKVWIIGSLSADIQPLILRKPTSFDMWTVLAKMYGRKKKVLRTYQIKRNIYSLKQGDLSVAAFYAALKTKWEELNYHENDDWNCGSDHSLYWEKECTFLFLGGLRDEFECIRSQILNCDEIPRIEEVYARVESEEQRRQVMHLDTSHGNAPSAFVSRASGTGQRPARRCSHCNKLGHSVDFCWDIHPEKRLVRGRPTSSRRSPSVSDSSQSNPASGTKSKISSDQLKELQAYISRLFTTPKEASTSEGAQLAQALVASSDQGNPSLGDWIVDSGATHHMTGDAKLFQEYQLSSGKQRVSMADGSSISVAGKWSLSLLNKYCLHNALHVPNIPDLLTGKKIGIGSVIDGLYRLPVQVASALISATSGQGVVAKLAWARGEHRRANRSLAPALVNLLLSRVLFTIRLELGAVADPSPRADRTTALSRSTIPRSMEYCKVGEVSTRLAEDGTYARQMDIARARPVWPRGTLAHDDGRLTRMVEDDENDGNDSARLAEEDVDGVLGNELRRWTALAAASDGRSRQLSTMNYGAGQGSPRWTRGV